MLTTQFSSSTLYSTSIEKRSVQSGDNELVIAVVKSGDERVQ